MLEPSLFIGVLILAFICEFIDSSLGMGYGTAATPILLILGFPALQIVPAVLLSELITGILSGYNHHRIGNVNFNTKSRHFKVMSVLAICSILGTTGAVLLAVSIPKLWLNLYIGILVLSMGGFILITRNKEFKFSWKKIIAIGSLSSFNKGMSGGGYGPLVTSGQILSGIESKSSVGITSLSEGLTSAVGVGMFSILGVTIYPDLAIPMIIGGILAVPIASYVTKRINDLILKRCIALLTIILGIVTLIKVL